MFGEKSGYDDGLFQRFIMCAPHAPLVKAKEIRKSGRSILSIHCLFYMVHLIHFNKRRDYSFTDDALEFVDNLFDLDRHRTFMASQTDCFFG